MKKAFYIPIFIACTVTACTDAPEQAHTTHTIEIADIKPGTLVAADSMVVTEDRINNAHFAVEVLATEHTANYGSYKVQAHYGHNYAESEFTMPRGGKSLKPVIHNTGNAYTYNIGFYYQDEPDFYEYYEVSANRGEIKMKYTTAYTFE